MHVKTSSFLKSAVRKDQYPDHDLPEVAFAGRSNVGKSSLINSLLNRKKLVRTSKTPGHTRLLNFYLVNDCICLVDLPGYGYAKVSKSAKESWLKMVEQYLSGRPNVRAVVHILDIRRDLNSDDIHWHGLLMELNLKPILVVTKVDKLSSNKRHQRLKALRKQLGKRGAELVPFSAVTKEGRDSVWEAIVQCIDVDVT